MTVTYSAETGHRGPDKIAAGSGFAYAAGRCTLGHAVDLCRNIVHSIVYGIVRDDRTRRRRKFIYIFLRLIGGQKKKTGGKKKNRNKMPNRPRPALSRGDCSRTPQMFRRGRAHIIYPDKRAKRRCVTRGHLRIPLRTARRYSENFF